MPNNITDVDTFTDPIQTVADGDAADQVKFALSPQGLSNRTRNLKNRLDYKEHYFSATLSGTSVAGGSKFTMVIDEENGGYSVTSDEVTILAAGTYLISLSINGKQDSAADGANVGGIVSGSTTGTILRAGAVRNSTDTTDTVSGSGTIVLQLAASETVQVKAESTGGTTLNATKNTLSILRVA